MSDTQAKTIEAKEGFWFATAFEVRLAIFNAWIALPLGIFLMHIRLWTFGLLVAVVIAMHIMESFGFKPRTAFRAIRSTLAGSRVSRRRRAFDKYTD
ncbi:MAG: IcmT/TraK family protein [Polaromonas sp.]|nr:IcmT/TraK family protein [Polaromonas sp.]